MNGWHFTRELDGWRWHRVNSCPGVPTITSGAFGSLLECLNDATRSGYSLVAHSETLSLPFPNISQRPFK
jgi:hypothetical protein